MPTYYIDPSAPTNGDGSIGSPFNTWPSTASNNVYLQKRGTVWNGNVTAFGRSNLTIGAYGSGAAPKISVTSGVAFNASNTTPLVVEDFEFESTASQAFVCSGGASITIRRVKATGTVAGIAISSSASAITDLILEDIEARNTSYTGERSGLFIGVQSNQITTAVLTNIKCNDSNGYGIQIKAGISNTAAPLVNLYMTNVTTNNNYATGIFLTTDATDDNSAKYIQNLYATNLTAIGNGGPGIIITARGGRGYVRRFITTDNNWAGLTSTGGFQFAGAQNIVASHGLSARNKTLASYDGVGLYFDQLAQAQSLPTENCVFHSCEAYGHYGYNPNPQDISASVVSCGIGSFFSRNCKAYGNLLHGNAAGICIGVSSFGFEYYNNTIINNRYGVVLEWNPSFSSNKLRNNIISNNWQHAIVAVDTGTRATSGNITLSGTTGVVTVTSTQADFATYAVGYFIIAGSGAGVIISKQSNTQVTMRVYADFSGTSFTNGNWQLSYGQNQAGINDYNCITGTIYNGSGQTVAVNTNDILQNPQLDGIYLSPTSPCIGSGEYVYPPLIDLQGRQMPVHQKVIGAMPFYQKFDKAQK